jgi:AhpD family alkylhydroperoxidase
MSGREFRRSRYHGPGELLRELVVLVRHLRRLLTLDLQARVPSALRERLMLVVTGVNRCRYCAAFHGRLALREGITREEARGLLAGLVDHCPDEEVPALLYARSWAEHRGRPGEAARQELRRIYGDSLATAIETVLHAIRVGNLLGNTWDYLLCNLSRGRFGCDPPAHREA